MKEGKENKSRDLPFSLTTSELLATEACPVLSSGLSNCSIPLQNWD